MQCVKIIAKAESITVFEYQGILYHCYAEKGKRHYYQVFTSGQLYQRTTDPITFPRLLIELYMPEIK